MHLLDMSSDFASNVGLILTVMAVERLKKRTVVGVMVQFNVFPWAYLVVKVFAGVILETARVVGN